MILLHHCSTATPLTTYYYVNAITITAENLFKMLLVFQLKKI